MGEKIMSGTAELPRAANTTIYQYFVAVVQNDEKTLVASRRGSGETEGRWWEGAVSRCAFLYFQFYTLRGYYLFEKLRGLSFPQAPKSLVTHARRDLCLCSRWVRFAHPVQSSPK